jgi:3-methyladenine DNA glycosylase/8-oxoguanine DNA glycosylase
MRSPVDLRLTLAPLRHGAHDPSWRVGSRSVWRATRTPDGPATQQLMTVASAAAVRVLAWGPGAAWLLESAPALVGADDDDEGFVPHHPVIRELWRRLPGLRIPRSQAVVEALVPLVIEQKVAGVEARQSYRSLVVALGEPAPDPAGASTAEPARAPTAPGAFEAAPTRTGTGLRVPPAPATLAATPSWAMHAWGIERKRADTIRRACSYARRLEEATSLAAPEARRRLRAIPGIGPWTAAEVALCALGDPDAVSLGDFHLPHQVCWALAGVPRGDDATMLELLEPYRGHRGRVLRLLAAGGVQAPRFGPRLARRGIHDQ